MLLLQKFKKEAANAGKTLTLKCFAFGNQLDQALIAILL
jgi:hypothetical protein